MNLQIIRTDHQLIHWYSTTKDTNNPRIEFNQEHLENFIYASMKIKAVVLLSNALELPSELLSYEISKGQLKLHNAIILPFTAKSLVKSWVNYLNT